jgi:hypothetical protein
MIPKRPVPDLIRDVQRFPACAKPVAMSIVWRDASAGEGRSEKIMLKQKAKAGGRFEDKIIPLYT